ncbi:MAG: hypothetical protein ACRD3E_10800, partial [Terriglobales bacterium]
MLIPIRHENMTARRWPVITLALIAINTLAFIATNSTIEQQQADAGAATRALVMYAAAHPELKLTGAAAEVVKKTRDEEPDLLKEFQTAPSTEAPSPDALLDSVDPRQTKMDKLARAYEDATSNSFIMKYG